MDRSLCRVGVLFGGRDVVIVVWNDKHARVAVRAVLVELANDVIAVTEALLVLNLNDEAVREIADDQVGHEVVEVVDDTSRTTVSLAGKIDVHRGIGTRRIRDLLVSLQHVAIVRTVLHPLV